MRIDSYAHGNRWRQIHPGEKGLLVLLSLVAAILSHHPGVPLTIALTMAGLTLLGAGIPWRGYLRLLLPPLLFLLWSCLLLPLTLAPTSSPLLFSPGIGMAVGFNRSEIPLALLIFSRSFGALCSLLFLTLTTPVSEIAGLLLRLGTPRLLVELMIITYRQIFILTEAFAQIRSAQKSRLGDRSLRISWRSTGDLIANILIKTVVRAQKNHQTLLARGYDRELHFLSPLRSAVPLYLLGSGSLGLLFLLFALLVPA